MGVTAPRFKTLRRLQQASFVLSWSIFLLTLASSRGWSGFFTTLAVSVITMPFEQYLLFRGRIEKREEKKNINLATSSTVPPLVEKNTPGSSTPGPVQGASPILDGDGGSSSTTLATLYQRPWVITRVTFTVFWVLALAGVLAITAFFDNWDWGVYLHAQIMEVVLVVAQVTVMVSLSVLTIKERKRFLVNLDGSHGGGGGGRLIQH